MKDDILRELVEGERAALVPAPGAKKATWTKVARSVAIAAPVPAAISSAPAAASKAAASGMKWWAKGIVALALGGAVVVGVQATRGRPADTVAASAEREVAAAAPEPSSSAAAAAAASDRPAVEPAEPVEPEAPAPEEAAHDETAGLAPSLAEPRDRTAPRASRDRSDVRDAGAPASAGADATISDLAEEARLLDAARKKLRAGTPRAALPSLHEHARRFPSGQLAEERVALTARAHCEAGDVAQGKKSASALRAAFPSSSHLARVDRACE